MEEEGRNTLQLMPGAIELGHWLSSHGIPMALVTRNVNCTVERFHVLWEAHGLSPLCPVVTRESPIPPKPDPAGIIHVFDTWGVPLGPELLMVGDSLSNDVVFAQAAGASTAYLDVDKKYSNASAIIPDLVVSSLAELPKGVLERFSLGGL
eukprot:m.355484 g.355484  ORF g.355484 m.355484 type:complete len:151 (+) comp16597_c1_seq44:469-921(+)